MNMQLAAILILAWVPLSPVGSPPQCASDARSAQSRPGPDFRYPEAQSTDDLGTILVRSLEGRVVDASGAAIVGALVERLSLEGRRREAVLTDANGCFAFRKVRSGQHGLRVSYPTFDSVILQARFSDGFEGDLELTMYPGR